ncbi:hypothetical protein [Lichenifustis flavocetrariae]|uniref:Helix-turn-helix domain-containing protein n=1 Tax=Lichenifustis flavocetrariae TaxID=2949735 RepID=A0AA42CM81_9HYPH|nr:hypothetical protein [Lichenifustis flavocetrariae]MCW6512409.1 helix-turn-helix domain-containing protein [Lichenifustis flavocetrariae]
MRWHAAARSRQCRLRNRLIKARQAAGLAIWLGLDPKVYMTHEQGRSTLEPAELRSYAEAFGVSHG